MAKLTYRQLPLLLSLALLAVAVRFIPWSKVATVFLAADWRWLALLVVLSAIYLTAKAARFWLMLKALDVDLPWQQSGLFYLSAQQFTFLPGGDMYRSLIMKQYANIPVRRTAAAVLLQGLIEGFGLVLAAVVFAVVMGQSERPALLAAVFFGLFLYLLRSEWLLTNPHVIKILDSLPLVKVNKPSLKRFSDDSKRLLSAQVLPRLLAITLVPIAAGIAIVFFSAQSLHITLGWFQAAVAYILPVALAYVAAIPGSSEGGMAGVLLLLGLPAGAAVALTMLTRAFMLGINFIVGPISLVILRRKYGQN